MIKKTTIFTFLLFCLLSSVAVGQTIDVTVEWDPSADDDTLVTDDILYQLQMTQTPTDDASWVDVGTETPGTTQDFTLLPDSGTWYLRVRARWFDRVLWSGPSNIINIPTAGPSLPVNLRITVIIEASP